MSRTITTTAYELAQRFVGLKEVAGTASNPLILGMLGLDQEWPQNDEVPWCSAFTNYVAWLLRLPRSKNLAARSWLSVGWPIRLDQAEAGFDVVVLSRGNDLSAGHVGFFAGYGANRVLLLGGNQNNRVSLAEYDMVRVVGVRRLLA